MSSRTAQNYADYVAVERVGWLGASRRVEKESLNNPRSPPLTNSRDELCDS